jgi:hypothetical protein
MCRTQTRKLDLKFESGKISVENVEKCRCPFMMDKNVIQIWNLFTKTDIPLYTCMSWLIRRESHLNMPKYFDAKYEHGVDYYQICTSYFVYLCYD